MSNIFEFPDKVLFIETLDVTNCILDNGKSDIDSIAKNIWEGSRNIFGFIFGDDGCHGIKDILNDWLQEGIVSVIFYIPRETAKEIRDTLVKKVRTHIIADKISSYIEKEIRKNIPNFDIYNLATTDELNTIFDVNRLKRDLDRDSKGEEQKIYIIGLRFTVTSSEKIGFYINNMPIKEDGGVIYGNSKILTNKLKNGFMLIRSDEGVDIDFYDTDSFTSKDYDVGSDLEDLDFHDDNLSFELDKEIKAITIESRSRERLTFSLDQSSDYVPKKIIDPNDVVSRDSKIYMESFFIPKDRGLKYLKLLLVYKDGKKIIAGGEYHQGLLDCEIIGDITIDLEKEEILFINHSGSNLRFINFEDTFWKLDESSIYKEPEHILEDIKSDGEIYTTFMFNDNNLPDNHIKTILDDNVEIDTIREIKQEERFTFKVKELEFNDSNISFDKNGILINYSKFKIARFEKEFSLNRTAFKMSNLGTIIDCFVERPNGMDFKWGGKVYSSHSDILGRAISSKPILFKNSSEGLFIESKLDSRYYILQLSSSSQKYILEDSNRSILIPNSELKELKVDIINRGYKNRPLVQFTLEI